MTKIKFNSAEQELLDAYEAGEFESDLDVQRRQYLTKSAEANVQERQAH